MSDAPAMVRQPPSAPGLRRRSSGGGMTTLRWRVNMPTAGRSVLGDGSFDSGRRWRHGGLVKAESGMVGPTPRSPDDVKAVAAALARRSLLWLFPESLGGAVSPERRSSRGLVCRDGHHRDACW